MLKKRRKIALVKQLLNHVLNCSILFVFCFERQTRSHGVKHCLIATKVRIKYNVKKSNLIMTKEQNSKTKDL